MALTKVQQSLSSTPSISDSGTSTAITIDSNGHVTLAGNLTVTGSTTTADNLVSADKNIILNYHASNDTSSSADGAGITIQDAVDASTDATLTWRASDDKFIFSHPLRMFGQFELPDNVKMVAGDGNDLQIFHNGAQSVITHPGSGDLRIDGNSIWIRETDGTNQISAYQGTAKLYKDGTERLATTSGGVTVAGTLTATTLAGTLSTAAQTNITSLGTLTGLTVQKASSGASATSNTVVTIEDDDNTELSILGGSSSVLAINFGHSGDNDEGIISFNTTSGSEDLGLSSTKDITYKSTSTNSTAGHHIFKSYNTQIIRFDGSNNNIYFGTTDYPSGMSSSSYKQLKIGGAVLADSGHAGGHNVELMNNLYVGSGNDRKFTHAAAAAAIQMTGGKIYFRTHDGGGASADATASVTQRIQIHNNGRVAIGDHSPEGPLDIKGGSYNSIILGSNRSDNNNKLCGIASYMYTNNTVSIFQGAFANGVNSVYYGSADGAHRGLQNHYFYVNSNYNATSGHTLAMRITSAGHVAIGAGKRFYFDYNSIANGDTYIDEYSANEVGITTGGSRKLAVSGGNLYVSGSVNANHNFSDERLKENIVVIPNALEKVNSLRGITYTRKDDESVGTGLIAQELEKVLPEAVYEAKMVHELENPDAVAWKSINYGNTVGLLVEAIKEQQTIIEDLKSRIETLEG